MRLQNAALYQQNKLSTEATICCKWCCSAVDDICWVNMLLRLLQTKDSDRCGNALFIFLYVHSLVAMIPLVLNCLHV